MIGRSLLLLSGVIATWSAAVSAQDAAGEWARSSLPRGEVSVEMPCAPGTTRSVVSADSDVLICDAGAYELNVLLTGGRPFGLAGTDDNLFDAMLDVAREDPSGVAQFSLAGRRAFRVDASQTPYRNALATIEVSPKKIVMITSEAKAMPAEPAVVSGMLNRMIGSLVFHSDKAPQ